LPRSHGPDTLRFYAVVPAADAASVEEAFPKAQKKGRDDRAPFFSG